MGGGVRIAGGLLIILSLLATPVVAEVLFAGDGQIEERLIRALMWSVSVGAFGVALFLLLVPDRARRHLEKNRSGYAISAATVALSLGAAECGLRLLGRPRRQKQTYRVKSAEFEYEVRLNEDGFRDDPFRVAKADGTRRIFLLGDSYVFGSGVKEEHNLDKLIEKSLRSETGTDHEVLNLGLPGTNPRDHLVTARAFADLEPDVIILNLYVDNDIESSRHETARGLQIVRLLRSIQLGDCMYDWIDGFDLEPKYRDMACRGDFNPWLLPRAKVGDNQRYYDQLTTRFSSQPLTRDSITGIRDLFPDCPFLLVLHPSKYQVSTEQFDELRKIGFVFERDQVVDRKLQDAIIAWAKEEEIETLDLLPALRAAPAGTYHALDDHYTAAGNRIAAAAIAEKLMPWR